MVSGSGYETKEDEEVADNTGMEGAGDTEAQRQVDTAQEEDDSIEELREALLVTRRERETSWMQHLQSVRNG